MRQKRKGSHLIKGFFLWEGLLTLLVVSFILHALLISVSIFRQVREQESQNRTGEALAFMELLERELGEGKVNQVSNQEIQLEAGGRHFKIILRNGKIYKMPGHHPYLIDVASWYLINQDQTILLEVTLKNGQTFNGAINYEK